ncbi:MAG: hypothetical protein F4047_06595 [Caldilineaceae bacterium SB0670_bin_27]|uniref:Uncharacterized protein n=1 Tax=Caldilineaceae bacterium SB0664_bin_27 TaxID=2605260 RepID=A0A6B0YSF8_9CHLR|nr:hypothetical protein [Caldilineaceae bacterium SB0664_bin_27]MYJ77812.1 hypothetical protein [Caldilineaceae bacterium SB0670_bin_27]
MRGGLRDDRRWADKVNDGAWALAILQRLQLSSHGLCICDRCIHLCHDIASDSSQYADLPGGTGLNNLRD